MQGSLAPTDPVVGVTSEHGEQPDKIVHGFNDGEIEGLHWSDAQFREQIHVYMDKLNFSLPDEDDDFWSVYDDQELEKLNERLALHHIRAHKVSINILHITHGMWEDTANITFCIFEPWFILLSAPSIDITGSTA
jgi:hypothetical protein